VPTLQPAPPLTARQRAKLLRDHREVPATHGLKLHTPRDDWIACQPESIQKLGQKYRGILNEEVFEVYNARAMKPDPELCVVEGVLQTVVSPGPFSTGMPDLDPPRTASVMSQPALPPSVRVRQKAQGTRPSTVGDVGGGARVRMLSSRRPESATAFMWPPRDYISTGGENTINDLVMPDNGMTPREPRGGGGALILEDRAAVDAYTEGHYAGEEAAYNARKMRKHKHKSARELKILADNADQNKRKGSESKAEPAEEKIPSGAEEASSPRWGTNDDTTRRASLEVTMPSIHVPVITTAPLRKVLFKLRKEVSS